MSTYIDYRCSFIYGFVLLIYTASAHVAMEGVEGESIILPCVHTSVKLTNEHLEVHWRHDDIRNVYDIMHGNSSVKEQDPAYKNRASVELQQCKTGDCSLKLTNLQPSDEGMYLCYVTVVQVFQKAELVVKKKYRAAQLNNHGTDTRLGSILHLIPAFGFILYIV